MIVGKIYRGKDEIAELSIKIKEDLLLKEKWYNDKEVDEESVLVAKVEDLSNNKYAYGIVAFDETYYNIKNIIYSDKSEYLLDCCIRMLVRQGFDENYKTIVAKVTISDKKVQQILSHIGFIIDKKTKSSLEMKVTVGSLSKNNCDKTT